MKRGLVGLAALGMAGWAWRRKTAAAGGVAIASTGLSAEPRGPDEG